MRSKKHRLAKRLMTAGESVVTLAGWLDKILGPSPEDPPPHTRHDLGVVIGSSVQAAKSYAAFTGRKEYNPNWNWWYFPAFSQAASA